MRLFLCAVCGYCMLSCGASWGRMVCGDPQLLGGQQRTNLTCICALLLLSWRNLSVASQNSLVFSKVFMPQARLMVIHLLFAWMYSRARMVMSVSSLFACLGCL